MAKLSGPHKRFRLYLNKGCHFLGVPVIPIKGSELRLKSSFRNELKLVRSETCQRNLVEMIFGFSIACAIAG